ncbi:serine kinase [candidate division WOR-3 bacterium RBG_13_43_14]|uniref:Serine kinase n=1 Tax=candidate division WOR-3 bacterium RBG_13_43_14 TaxID=1802590 RepID=A0A1F4U6Y9_UNCW3|nr:MAG: serine kinase [candidate division WOR-3 bacterium RBG_13_43_14]
MYISDIIKAGNLQVIYGEHLTKRAIKGGYASDLLSDVIGNSKADDIWVTLQGHPNIIAVAKLKELAGIIIVNGRRPEADTLNKAKAEDIIILSSNLPAFEIIGKLYAFGISGLR